MFERLERRQFLSAVYYDADSTSIRIHGTSGDDQITVERHGDRFLIQLNDQRKWLNAKPVTWIEVDSFAGDDRVDLHAIGIRAQEFGFEGKDTLIGGSADDILYGGDGADRLLGGPGHDDLRGEGGHDRLIGDSGNDTLTGDGGDDQMSGGGGDDYLVSGSGSDLLDGGPGADWCNRYADRGTIHNIEGQTFFNPSDNPDPFTHLSIHRSHTGVFSVIVNATHGASGWKDHFDEMTRTGDDFTASVFGEDLASPDSARSQVVITNTHTYTLGKLADGTCTFNAQSPRQTIASMTITIVHGAAVKTPTWPGPYTYPSIVPYKP